VLELGFSTLIFKLWLLVAPIAQGSCKSVSRIYLYCTHGMSNLQFPVVLLDLVSSDLQKTRERDGTPGAPFTRHSVINTLFSCVLSLAFSCVPSNVYKDVAGVLQQLA